MVSLFFMMRSLNLQSLIYISKPVQRSRTCWISSESSALLSYDCFSLSFSECTILSSSARLLLQSCLKPLEGASSLLDLFSLALRFSLSSSSRYLVLRSAQALLAVSPYLKRWATSTSVLRLQKGQVMNRLALLILMKQNSQIMCSAVQMMMGQCLRSSRDRQQILQSPSSNSKGSSGSAYSAFIQIIIAYKPAQPNRRERRLRIGVDWAVGALHDYIISMQSYKVIEPIGQGSFGSVYLAQDESGQRYALKKIHIDPFQIDQALLEIELMKKFQHPNLVRIFNYHLDEDVEELQIVMEYCEQGDLMRHFTKNKKMATKEILGILRQIFHAFILMTVKGVIHRDLKPENILLGAGGVVKIGDFGCAKSVGEMDMSKVDNFSLDKGTFLYVSPEQLRNEKYSFKCDVWAVGCIAYLLTFGYHPFLDSKPHNTLLNIQKRTEGKFIELDASADPTLVKLISLCLIYEDKERASWRQVWLSRVFSPKVTDIRRFVDYLKNITNIASWITKEFWKIRKEFAISKNSDQIFVYFLIKFQYTNLKMALKVLKKSANYRYLFDENAFNQYEPNEEQFHEVKKAYLQHEKYFLSIKKTMQSKESFAEIAAREPERASCFSDIEKSIRAAYKILTDVRQAPKKDNKVWMALAYWLNFQAWFSFEKNPVHQKVLSDFPGNVNAVISEQLQKYEQGYVQ